MSDTKEKPSRGGTSIVGIALPAVFAAAAAFGGARVAGAHHAPAGAPAEHVEVAKPPGPTLALDPFLLSVTDANKKAHPMKVTIAIEFDVPEKGEKGEEALKAMTPRIRDAVLGYLRAISYEEAIDPAGGVKLRADIIERLRTSGAPVASHVLITDLVIQ
jgi:flagellar protein FliL